MASVDLAPDMLTELGDVATDPALAASAYDAPPDPEFDTAGDAPAAAASDMTWIYIGGGVAAAAVAAFFLLK